MATSTLKHTTIATKTIEGITAPFNGTVSANVNTSVLGVDIDKIVSAWAYADTGTPLVCYSVKGANVLQLRAPSNTNNTVVSINLLYLV